MSTSQRASVPAPPSLEELATHCTSLRAAWDTAVRIAPTVQPVLIAGEPGTGKRWLAHALHDCVEPGGLPFVAVDCASAGNDPLAALRSVRMPEGERGTLLLENIDHLSRPAQAVLLRALEDSHPRRAAARRRRSWRPLERLRIVSTCERSLSHEALSGRFRSDLYFRLGVVSLRLAPLRERPDEIAPLAHVLGRRYAPAAGELRLTACALEALVAHPWPGNLRELDRTIARATALANGGAIDASHLGLDATDGAAAPGGRGPAVDALLERLAEYGLPLRHIEDAYVAAVLRRARGNKSRAARVLGVNRTTLYRREG